MNPDPAARLRQYNGFNQLLSVTPAGAAPTTFAYDGNGNQTSKTDAFGTTAYAYNLDNRLVDIAGPTGASHFEYDANGLRTKKSDSTGTRSYLLDGLSVVAEYAPDASKLAWYTQSLARIDEVLNVANGQGKYWYETDALGSTYAMTNGSGAVASRSAYDVFGERSLASAYDVGQPFGFTGREHDASGLVYARARYLNSIHGQWTQPDRLGMIDGPNRYGYVAQRPTLQIDPTGNFFIAPMITGAILGGLFAGLTGYMGGLRGFALVENILVGATTAALGAILPPFPRGSTELAGMIAGGAVSALKNALGQLIAIVSGTATGFDRKAFVVDVITGALSGALGGAFQPGSKLYQSLVRSVTGTVQEQWQFMMTSAMLGGIGGGMFDTVFAYVQRQNAMDAALFGDGEDQLMCLPRGS